MSAKTKGKGKQRAEPDEREALLASSSSQARYAAIDDEVDDHRPSGASRIRSILWTASIILFSILLSGLLFLALLAYSFKPSEKELETLPKTAFAYEPPRDIQVINVSEDGILVNMTIQCGIDADQAFGLARSEDRGGGADWWEDLRRWSARKALAQVSPRAINVEIDDFVHIYPGNSPSSPLLSVSVLDPVLVPLVEGVISRTDSTWLKPVRVTALAKPLATTGQLWEFAQHAWAEGHVSVLVDVAQVRVSLPAGRWWSKFGQGVKEDLQLKVQMAVPALPGLPAPGHPLNLSDMVHLDSYSFKNDERDSSLRIVANVSIPNPLFNITAADVPFNIPFAISLADGSKMAETVTLPLHIDPSQHHLNLGITGQIVANLSDRTTSKHASPLSRFLQNYLHGRDNPILVQGLSDIPRFAHSDVVRPPNWLLSSLPSLKLPSLTFPGPRPPPKIIQSVTIEHMRIAERSGKMTASGTVVAQVELPAGMQSVDVNIVEVLPDVFVFDGPADESNEDIDPEDPPPKAFGRIQPDDFLDSTTESAQDPIHPHRLVVRAPLNSVPLQVLPGRDSILSDFVGKVVFKGGAQAGVKGKASVRVELVGVDGRVLLDGLPVNGEFWVGRQR